jgi:hypothetical protein
MTLQILLKSASEAQRVKKRRGLKNYWMGGIVVIIMVEHSSTPFLLGRSAAKRQTTNDKRQTTNDKKIMGAVLALSSPLRRNPVIF